MLKLLLHPLVMPIYTLALYYEIERQSYVVDYAKVIWLEVMLMLSMICINFLTYQHTDGKSPLTDIHSSLSARIINATTLIIIYAITTFSIYAYRPYTRGYIHVMMIYVIPTLLNIFSGDAASKISNRLASTFFSRCNAAPPAFIGALSGFTIMIGYKTSADTFWPFIISLLMMALHATFCNYNDEDSKSNAAPQLYWYAIGIMQAVILMMWDF